MPDDVKSPLSRRQFLAAAAAAGGVAAAGAGRGLDELNAMAAEVARAGEAPGLGGPPRMKIAELLSPPPDPLWQLVKQCGVNDVVGAWSGPSETGEPPWSLPALERLKSTYEESGFRLAVIEARPPLIKSKLGLPGRDDEIATVCELIRNMGTLDIPVWCYEWMVLGVLRTSSTLPSRGGALVTGYDNALFDSKSLTDCGVVEDEKIWANLQYFLNRVLPVAEKANVKLALHPDDPPLSPIRGVARIIRSVESFQRVLDLVPSSSNGIALCQGNFTLMTDDLPGVIRQFGAAEEDLLRPFPRRARHAGEVRGNVSRRRPDRHGGLHARLPRHWLRRRLPTGPRADAFGRQQFETKLLVDRAAVRHWVHQGASGRCLHRLTSRPRQWSHPGRALNMIRRYERCMT